MSTPNTTQMTCPKCSTTFDIEQYNVINAQTQPELREKLLNGSIFLQTCPRCGTHMHAAYTCVYSNDEKKFLVSFQHGQTRGHTAHAAIQAASGAHLGGLFGAHPHLGGRTG